MNNYDSILKEKKVYKDPEPIIKKSVFSKYFFIDILVIIIGLFISYIVYYRNVLSPKNVIIDDLEYFLKIEEKIFKPLQLDTSSDYAFNGTLSFDNLKYDYDIARKDKDLILGLKLDNNKVQYYLENNTVYTNFASFLSDSYIVTNNKHKWINMLREYRSNIDEILSSSNQLLKKLYIDDKTPVVEVTCLLKKDEINKLFGTTLILDDVEATFVFRNNALTNKLLDGKLVINNRTKNSRSTITYKNGTFVVTDSKGSSVRYLLQFEKKKFTLKIFKSEELYSVFSGEKKDDGYYYNYQVIDKIYNLSLVVISGDSVIYKFSSNIADDNNHTHEKKLEIVRFDSINPITERSNSNNKTYSNLTDEEKARYDAFNDALISPIRNFVNEYKNTIK